MCLKTTPENYQRCFFWDAGALGPGDTISFFITQKIFPMYN